MTFVIGIVFLAFAAWHAVQRRYWRNPQEAINSPALVPMALVASVFFFTATFIGIAAKTAAIFWVIWGLTLVSLWVIRKGTTALATVGCLIALALGSFFLVQQPSPSEAQAQVVQTEDGKKLPYKGDNKPAADKPVAGSATTNDTDALPSLQDGKGPVHSWTELVGRVHAMPANIERTYIDAIDERSKYIGTWSDVKKYATLEKKYDGDTRVVIVLNSNVSKKEARDLVRKDVGEATDKLPVFNLGDTALKNTRGVDSGQIADFADGRSQVRVLLTVPVIKKDKNGKTIMTADTKAAKKGVGVLTECKNPSTGLVHNPKPVPATPGKPDSPKSTAPETPTAPPTKSTPSPTPPTTTPPTTQPPTTSPPPSSPPPTTKPPVCEWNPKLPPGHPDCLKPKDPGDSVPAPSGKPTAPAPEGPAETSPPEEPNPAKPSDKPHDPAPSVTAPGATQGPTKELPPAQPTVAPEPTKPDGPSNDPDGGQQMVTPEASGFVGAGAFVSLVLTSFLIGRPRLRKDNA